MQIPWPANGVWGFGSWEATGWTLAWYYLSSLVLYRTFAQGLHIIYAASLQNNIFRKNPDDPSVKGLSYFQTKRGTRLLTSGWWGIVGTSTYFGDWLQALPFSLPTGIAGYVMMPRGSIGSIFTGAVGGSDEPVTMVDGSHAI